MFAGYKNEKVCQICEKPGDTVRCRGPCGGHYHVKCVQKTATKYSPETKKSRGRPRKSVRTPIPAGKRSSTGIPSKKENEEKMEVDASEDQNEASSSQQVSRAKFVKPVLRRSRRVFEECERLKNEKKTNVVDSEGEQQIRDAKESDKDERMEVDVEPEVKTEKIPELEKDHLELTQIELEDVVKKNKAVVVEDNSPSMEMEGNSSKIAEEVVDEIDVDGKTQEVDVKIGGENKSQEVKSEKIEKIDTENMSEEVDKIDVENKSQEVELKIDTEEETAKIEAENKSPEVKCEKVEKIDTEATSEEVEAKIDTEVTSEKIDTEGTSQVVETKIDAEIVPAKDDNGAVDKAEPSTSHQSQVESDKLDVIEESSKSGSSDVPDNDDATASDVSENFNGSTKTDTSNGIDFKCNFCAEGIMYPCFTCGNDVEENTGDTERYSCYIRKSLILFIVT